MFLSGDVIHCLKFKLHVSRFPFRFVSESYRLISEVLNGPKPLNAFKVLEMFFGGLTIMWGLTCGQRRFFVGPGYREKSMLQSGWFGGHEYQKGVRLDCTRSEAS